MDHEDERAVAHGRKDLEDGLKEGRHRDAEHDGHRTVEHPALAARALEEHGKRRENEGGEKLVGRTEERPDAHAAGEAEHVGADEGEHRGNDRVAEERLNRRLFLDVDRSEAFLEAHAADTGHGVNGRQSESGHAHREDAGGDVGRHTEDIGEEARNRAREELEGRARGQLAVRQSGADDDRSDHAERAFVNAVVGTIVRESNS